MATKKQTVNRLVEQPAPTTNIDSAAAPVSEGGVTEETVTADVTVDSPVAELPVQVEPPPSSEAPHNFTPEQVLVHLRENGNPQQKAMLETVDNFCAVNSFPFSKGMPAAAAAQHQFLQGLLQSLVKLDTVSMRQLWVAIIHVASKNSEPKSAFSDTCARAAAVHWNRYGAEKHDLYANLVGLISHMADKERSTRVKDYWSRKSFDKIPMDQKQRDGFNTVFEMYGL